MNLARHQQHPQKVLIYFKFLDRASDNSWKKKSNFVGFEINIRINKFAENHFILVDSVFLLWHHKKAPMI